MRSLGPDLGDVDLAARAFVATALGRLTRGWISSSLLVGAPMRSRTAPRPTPECVREGAELRVAEEECDLCEIRLGPLEILERQPAACLLDQISIDEAASSELTLQRSGADSDPGREIR